MKHRHKLMCAVFQQYFPLICSTRHRLFVLHTFSSLVPPSFSHYLDTPQLTYSWSWALLRVWQIFCFQDILTTSNSHTGICSLVYMYSVNFYCGAHSVYFWWDSGFRPVQSRPCELVPSNLFNSRLNCCQQVLVRVPCSWYGIFN